MNSVLLWIGGLMVAALGLLFAAPYFVDWNSYRGVFEEEASRLLGRKVQVGGRVNLRLLPSPYVRFERVRVSDIEATLGEPFFRAEAFTLWLSVTPLLRGTFEAREIELDRPVLRLSIGPDGTGNWQAFRVTPGALPFVPNDVVLQQVKLKNATISLKSPSNPEPAELTGLTGELSATALDGPYRFRGDLKLADGNDARAALRHQHPRSRRPFALQGHTADPRQRQHLRTRRRPERIHRSRPPRWHLDRAYPPGHSRAAPAHSRPRSGAGQGQSPQGQQGQRQRGQPDAGVIDLKATLAGDVDAVKLSELAMMFEQDGKPQLLAGEAGATWRNGLRLETRLTSRWLDLDRLAASAAPSAANPLDAARSMIEAIATMLPANGTSFVTLDVDQINLGGEAVSDARLVLARAGGRTSIGELKAALPGNSRASVRGTLGGGGDARAFDGEIVLRGASLQRFAAWAGAGRSQIAAGRGDGAFSLAGQLRLVPGQVDINNASMEMASGQLRGDVGWRWQGARELRLGIDGVTVDISGIAPGLLDPAAWGSRIDSTGDTGQSTVAALAASAQAVENTVGNLRIRLRAQELTDGTRSLRDVDADLGVKGNVLSIAALRFSTTDGVQADLQGDLKTLDKSPTGFVRGWLTARSPAAVVSLASILPGMDAQARAGRAPQVAKVDLGFSVQLGGNRAERLLVRADGTVDDARLGLSLTMDGGLSGWRAAPIDAMATLEGADLSRTLRRLSGTSVGPQRAGQSATVAHDPGSRDETREGSLFVRAIGPDAGALTAFAQLDLVGTGLSYSGRAGIGADDTLDLSGDVNVLAADAAELLVLAGANRRPRLPGMGVEGTMAVSRKAGTMTLETPGMTVGASRLTGLITLASAGDKVRLGGRLAASEIALPVLLGIVLGQPPDGALRDPAADADVADIWPDAPFALGILDGLEGKLQITAPAMHIAPGLTVENVATAAEIAPGKLSLTELGGTAFGGTLEASATLANAPGGAGFTFDGRLRNARLDRLTLPASRNQQGLGEANVSLRLEGRSVTPRGIVAVATGRGEIDIRNGRVRDIAPAAVDSAAARLIDSDTDIARGRIEEAIRADMQGHVLTIGNRKLPITVADGVLKFGALQLETPDARIANTTLLDLQSMRVDSEWQITSRKTAPQRQPGTTRAPLPSIAVVFTGPLAALPQSQPRLSVDLLEREITVRKMERDVERLEELRRKDQERARIEAERLRRLDEAAQGPRCR